MSALSSSLKSNLNTLYKSKNEFEWLMTQDNVSLNKVDRLFKLKKEIVYSLSCILSVMSEDILSTSFYTSVNIVEQGILDILREKQIELENIEKPYNINMCDAKRVMSFLYSMEILQNYTSINVRNEEKLLELKNAYLLVNNSKQKEVALTYLLKMLESYSDGIRRIFEFVCEHPKKSELSLENKQEIARIFSNISLGFKEDVIRNKVYNEKIESENYVPYTKEYFSFYEELFIGLARTCDFNLPRFYFKIEKDLDEVILNNQYISLVSKFICEKYEYDLSNEIGKLKNIESENIDKVKDLVTNLTKNSRLPNCNELLRKIKDTGMLPNYLIDSNDYTVIFDIATNTDFLFNDEVQVNSVIDDVSKKILEKFDYEEYIKGYKYNKNDIIKQVAHFRQYYISILSDAKKDILKIYQERMENIISNSNLRQYDIKEVNDKISDIKIEIKILQNALKYINKNFREFSKNNLKIYTRAIQRRYHVEDLYENLEKKKLKNSYVSKAKNLIDKEKEYLKSFIDKKVIKEDLCNELLNNVICDDYKLKQEVLERFSV